MGMRKDWIKANFLVNNSTTINLENDLDQVTNSFLLFFKRI